MSDIMFNDIEELSPNIDSSFLKKHSEIIQKLKAPKGQFNNFGKYKYRNCEDILEAVKPLIGDPLLGDLVLTVSDELVLVGDRYYIKATAKLCGAGGQSEVTAFAREPESVKGMQSPQVTGSVSSYARKYALNGLFCIDDTKDPDSSNNTESYKVEDNEANPGDYTFMFGKFNGRKLSQIDNGELANYYKWLKSQNNDSPASRDTLASIELYLGD